MPGGDGYGILAIAIAPSNRAGELPLPIDLALYQPDIAQNAATLIRLGACLGVGIHLIHPAGFTVSDKSFRRAGLDYIERAQLTEHVSFQSFDAWRTTAGKRLVLLTTKASESAYTARYEPADILMVGRESAGVPEFVAAGVDLKVRIPMRPGLRSLNVALAGAMIIGEAMRQTALFESLA